MSVLLKRLKSVRNGLCYASFILFSTLAGPNLALAATETGTENSLDKIRSQFQQLESLAKRGQLNSDDPRLAELRTYPLYPYIEYNRISSRGTALSVADVERFIAQYPDHHLGGLLRWQLSKTLAGQSRWDDFLKYYDTLERPDATLQCMHAQALWETGARSKAFDEGLALWRQGESQPDACNPIFDRLRAEKKITSEIALDRLISALEQGNPGLAKYVQRYVSDAEDLKIAKEAQGIYQNPNKVLVLKGAVLERTETLARLQHLALKRAYRGGASKTLELALKLDDRLIDTDQTLAIRERAGVRLAKDLEPEIETQLSQLDPDFKISELTEWRVRLALYDQNWATAASLIARLPDDVQQEDRWRYWRAIATARSENDEPEFGTLVEERSFYGFLASEWSGQPYSLNQQSPRFTDEVYQTLSEAEPMSRIRELIALERYTVARSEWNQWKERLSTTERQAVAHLLRDMEWHQQGILTAAYEGLWNDLKLRFPVVHFEQFTQHAQRRSIDPVWALAISRQESALFTYARSSAGARGLMQLMPKTASQTAKQAGIHYTGVRALYNPDTNIQLGTAYLGQMYEQFNGNRAYASAAYNAGPHRVKRWLADGADQLPLDIWIETIPFDETRNYVQNVLSFALIYAEMKGISAGLLNDRERTQLAMR